MKKKNILIIVGVVIVLAAFVLMTAQVQPK